MAERITIQDIADELGVSRNTVSKAINNTGLLAGFLTLVNRIIWQKPHNCGFFYVKFIKF